MNAIRQIFTVILGFGLVVSLLYGYFIIVSVTIFPLLLGLFLIYKGVVYLGSQVWGYLDAGIWENQSATDLIKNLQLFGELSVWAESPQSLVGIHKLLNFINGGLACILVGVGLISLTVYIVEFSDRRESNSSGNKFMASPQSPTLSERVKNHPVTVYMGVAAMIITILSVF